MQILNWDSNVEVEISETEAISGLEHNVIADPDFQFLDPTNPQPHPNNIH